MPVTAPRPASKGEKEKARALDRSASSPGYQNILNVFIKDLGQSVRLYTVYNIFRVATVAVTFAVRLSESSKAKSVAVKLKPPSRALIFRFERIGIVFLLSTTL